MDDECKAEHRVTTESIREHGPKRTKPDTQLGKRNAGSGQSSPLQRGQILEEAARLFLELGYERTRMQDIASIFGVTHAALYYYFPRKSDILVELNLSALDLLLAGARGAEEVSTSAPERFQLQFEAHIRFVVGNLPLVGCFFHYDRSMEAADLQEIHRLRRRYTGMLVTSFAEAQADGEFDCSIEARTAVNTLLGAANWMCRWLSMEDKAGSDELVTQIGGMLAKGFYRPASPPR
jgi:AcrR family transcriptional regulator